MADRGNPPGSNRPFLNGSGFWIGVAGIGLLVLIIVSALQGPREASHRVPETRNSETTVPAPSKQIPQPR